MLRVDRINILSKKKKITSKLSTLFFKKVIKKYQKQKTLQKLTIKTGICFM